MKEKRRKQNFLKKNFLYALVIILILPQYLKAQEKDFVNLFFKATTIKNGVKFWKCEMSYTGTPIKLKSISPKTKIEELLQKRKSQRVYTGEKTSFFALSSLLYYANGVRKDGKRFHPSAGAFYPFKIYIVVNKVNSIQRGVYLYQEKINSIIRLECNQKAFGSFFNNLYPRKRILKKSSFFFVYVADFKNIRKKYMNRSLRYVFTELGTIVQNMYLLSKEFSLGTVFLGAYYDDFINNILKLNKNRYYVCGIQVFGKVK